MQNHPIYLMKPLFDWLDGLIRDHGDYLYMLLVMFQFRSSLGF